MGKDPRASLTNRPSAAPKVVLQGRYELECRIGVGGMSTVYLGRDLRFGDIDRWCAVKEIVNTGQDSQTRRLNLENFVREANILAGLAHQGIPKVYDFFSQDTRSYLVLEFVEGIDLEELWSKTKSPMAPRDVVNWALQLCDVLAYLHEQKQPVIFRDVKPSNIMLTPQQRIVLIDFGIAKVLQSGPKGTMIGTEGYAPPEQYRGIADARTDVYALGATMHHLLSGRDPRLEAPFTFAERPMRATNPDVSPALENVVNKALEYEADKRFATIREFAAALQGTLDNSGTLRRTGRTPASQALDTSKIGGTARPVGNQVTPVWRFECEDEIRSSPRVLDSLLYVGCYDHNLYALNAATGKFAWKYPTEGGISSTPLPTPSAVFVGSEDNSLYALDPLRGQLLWRAATRGPIRSSPRLAGDIVIIGSDDGMVYAIRDDRNIVWRFQALSCVRSSALVTNDTAIVGSDDGMIYGIQLRDGRQRWKYHAGRFVISSPALNDRLVIFGAGDAAIHAVDLRSGWAIWRVRTGGPIVSSAAITDGKVYIGSSDGNLYALDAHSGRVVWKSDMGCQIASTPFVTADAVYFGCEDGVVYALDRQNGKRRWTYRTGGLVTSSPVVTGGRVYIGSTDRFIYAFAT